MRRAILIALVLAGCGGGEKAVERAAKTCAPTEGQAEAVVSAPADTPSRVRPGPGMELKATKRNLAAARIGDPLGVTGVSRGTDCAPLAGATVQMHQTNGRGRYGPVMKGDGRRRGPTRMAATRSTPSSRRATTAGRRTSTSRSATPTPRASSPSSSSARQPTGPSTTSRCAPASLRRDGPPGAQRQMP